MVNEALFSSERQDWGTPIDFFNKLNEKYGFTLDAAASRDNAKCEIFFTAEEDGLSKSWQGHRVFVNPPYARGITGLWVEKARKEFEKGNVKICLLLPARTDTKWFHENCFPQHGARIEFVRGRLKFEGAQNGAPFPSILVFYGF